MRYPVIFSVEFFAVDVVSPPPSYTPKSVLDKGKGPASVVTAESTDILKNEYLRQFGFDV